MIWPALSFIARILRPILPFLAVWVARGQLARQQAKSEALEGYRKTREKIDDAPVASDPDTARKRLSDRDPNKR